VVGEPADRAVRDADGGGGFLVAVDFDVGEAVAVNVLFADVAPAAAVGNVA
jgi:hypothetical protein